MTHHITSINEYLHQTNEIAKKNRVKKAVLACTLFLAIFSLGFGIYSSNENIQPPVNQYNNIVEPVSEIENKKFGKVFLAFDPDELNGVENIEEFLIKKNKQKSLINPEAKEDDGDSPQEWNKDEVRNRIIIKGNYYAIH